MFFVENISNAKYQQSSNLLAFDIHYDYHF
nr:MAG TPA: hypothetical protein [Caudoviricetes sp.]